MKIKSIKKVENESVYNMTVRQYHNYLIQGGVISKNCDALRYFCTWWTSPADKNRTAQSGNRWTEDMLEDWDNASESMRKIMRDLYGEPVR